MKRWGRAGMLVVALVTSGVLVGVSRAGGAAVTEPITIELNTGHCDEAERSRCRVYPMTASDRDRSDGQTVTVNAPVLDVDGTAVGRMREVCTYLGGVTHSCTQVFSLKDGPHTDAGTIVTIGVIGEWVEGVNGELAVTGGTEAYENAGGAAIKVWDGHDFIFTLHLIP